MKIVEISPFSLSNSMEHIAAFAKAKSLSWEIELYPTFDESFLQDCVGALIDISSSEEVLSKLSTWPTNVRLVECFDSFQRDGGVWYPRLQIAEALRNIIVERVRNLDTRAAAYIIGDDQDARVAASVLTDLGYEKFFLAGYDAEKLEQTARILRRNFIGVEFLCVEAATVITQKVQAGILVNCMDLTHDEDLKGDLSYFNFMKADGLVLDLAHADSLILLEEADKAGLKVIPTADIFLNRDLLFLDHCGLSSEFSKQDFKDSWESFSKSHPLSSYKKRHS